MRVWNVQPSSRIPEGMRGEDLEGRLKDDVRVLLRRLREEAGMSQEALAQRLDVTQGYISKLEAGEIRPDFVRVWQVCLALGTSLAEFVSRLDRGLKGS